MKTSFYFCGIVIISLITSINLTTKSISYNYKSKNVIHQDYEASKAKATIMLTSFEKNNQKINTDIEIAKHNFKIINQQTK